MTTEVNSVSTAAKGALDQARWEPCHKPTMTGDGLNPKNGDDFGKVYDIGFTTFSGRPNDDMTTHIFA